ncbi:metal ABC transporter solute-binding protein, Zn/Mn family [Lottiidibacillus patelloidae]|nr:zinc ABC transporter substrate-binding protein [Lottiidibacillus patelloidae]
MKKIKMLFFLLLSLGIIAGCNTTENNSDKIQVTTTIGMIADIVKNVGGDLVEVNGLMGPGVDPHLYKASQGDIAKLENADIIFYNGLNLEGKMNDIFVKMARTTPTYAVTEKIDKKYLLDDPENPDHIDPHLWFNVELWMSAVEVVRDAMIEQDPENKDDYTKNAEAYLKELADLHEYVKAQVATVPEESRVLVTAHDAFGYFGNAYGFEVMGLQGLSTDSEFGLKDIKHLVDVLENRNIKAVFIETSISDESIKALVEGAKKRDHQVSIGGELFSDAMGEPGTEEGTYIGMVKHNIDTIVSALK